MSSVNVNFEDLIRFKQTLDKNAANFEEIRKQIGDTITNITNTDWQDPKSEQFKNMFFTQSDKDITALVDTMMRFSQYLQQKIEILQQYHATNINF